MAILIATLVATAFVVHAFLRVRESRQRSAELAFRLERELAAALLYERHQTMARRFERPIDVVSTVSTSKP